MDAMTFSRRTADVRSRPGDLILALAGLDEEMRALGMDIDVSYADDALMRLYREVNVYMDEHYFDLRERNVTCPLE